MIPLKNYAFGLPTKLMISIFSPFCKNLPYKVPCHYAISRALCGLHREQPKKKNICFFPLDDKINSGYQKNTDAKKVKTNYLK